MNKNAFSFGNGNLLRIVFTVCLLFGPTVGDLLSREPEEKVVALTGPKGTLVQWEGSLLSAQQPRREGWIGYLVDRQRDGETTWTRLTPNPVSRAPLEEFEKALGPSADRLASLLGFSDRDRLWAAFVEGNESLVRFGMLTPDLRRLIGLSYVDTAVKTTDSSRCRYRVVMVKKDGSVSSPLGIAETEASLPAGPQGVKAEQKEGTETVLVAWEPSPSDRWVVGYHVERSTDPLGHFTRLTRIPLLLTSSGGEGTPAVGEYSDDLSNGDLPAVLFYRVVAVDLAGNESRPSEPVEVRPKDTAPPPSPRNLVVNPTDEGLRLSWDAVEDQGLLGYNVYRSHQGSPENRPLKLNRRPIPPEASPEYLDLFVKPDLPFFYQVTAVDLSGNESEPCAPELGIRSIPIVPEAPTDIRVALEGRRPVVTWELSPEEDILGYFILRTAHPNDPPSLISPLLPAGSGRWEDGEAEQWEGGIVWYRVQAVHRSGAVGSPSVPAVIVLPDRTLPWPPLGFRGYVEGDEVRLFWEAPPDPDITGFLLFRRKGRNGEFVCLTPQPLTMGKGRFLQYADSDFKNGESAAYYLVSVDGAGNRSRPTPVVEF